MSGFRLKPPEAKPAALQAAPVAAWVPWQAHSQMVLVSPSGQRMYMKERQALAGGCRVSRVRFCRVCPLFFLGCGAEAGLAMPYFVGLLDLGANLAGGSVGVSRRREQSSAWRFTPGLLLGCSSAESDPRRGLGAAA